MVKERAASKPASGPIIPASAKAEAPIHPRNCIPNALSQKAFTSPRPSFVIPAPVAMTVA